MERNGVEPISSWSRVGHVAVAGLATAALLAAFCFAPAEKTMGAMQKILYFHVPLAWFSLIAFLAMAVTGVLYLRSRISDWDHWSQACAEVGWICCTLTLLTGSLWAHAAWNTWWTWDPRLTTVLLLWTMYSGYLLLRANLEDPQQSARFRAVLAIVGTLDLPMIVLVTHWFRGIHPGMPAMEPAMHAVLWLCVAAFSLLFTLLIIRRRGKLRLASPSDMLETHNN
jgi:heme exporter protein C